MIRFATGSNKMYGLQEVKHKFGPHPTVNSELLYKIRHGKVHPKVDIERLKEKVHFKDGSKEEFDAVIAFGFVLAHPFLKRI